MAIYYAIIAVFSVGIAWVFLKAGPVRPWDENGRIIPAKPKTQREELIEERDTVARQLEILKDPVRGGKNRSDFSRVNITKLQAVLDELETEIAELKAG